MSVLLPSSSMMGLNVDERRPPTQHRTTLVQQQQQQRQSSRRLFRFSSYSAKTRASLSLAAVEDRRLLCSLPMPFQHSRFNIDRQCSRSVENLSTGNHQQHSAPISSSLHILGGGSTKASVISRHHSSFFPATIAGGKKQSMMTMQSPFHYNSSSTLANDQSFTSSSAGGALHRTPSGAQRKIRQRREEKLQQQLASMAKNNAQNSAQQQRLSNANGNGRNSMIIEGGNDQFSIASAAASPSSFAQFSSPTIGYKATEQRVDDLSEYRNLIAKHGYQSILEKDQRNSGLLEKAPSTTSILSMSNSSLSTGSTTHLCARPTAFGSASFTEKPSRPPRNFEHSKTSANESTSPPMAAENDLVVELNAKFFAAQKFASDERRAFSSSTTAIGAPQQALKSSSYSTTYIHPPTTNFGSFAGASSAGGMGQKPTIQVYPLPAPRHTSLGSNSPPDSLLLKKPPPVPKKPNVLNITEQRPFAQQLPPQSEDGYTQSFSLNDFSAGSPVDEPQLQQKTILPPTPFTSTDSSCSSSSFGPSKSHLPPKTEKELTANRTPLKEPVDDNSTYFSSTAIQSHQKGPPLVPKTPPPELLKPTNNGKFSAENGDKLIGKNVAIDADRHPLHTITNGKSAALFSTAELVQNNNSIILPTFFHPLKKSPSFTSLQKSIDYARCNPEEHSDDQLRELDEKRVELINSLSKKVSERELDKEAVNEELETVGQIWTGISSQIDDPSLFERLSHHLYQATQLSALSVTLQLSLERFDGSGAQIGAATDNDDDDLADWRRRRLIQQIDDVEMIRRAFLDRDARFDARLERILHPDAMLEWRFYKDTLQKLTAEMRAIDEKIKNVSAQLEALQTTVVGGGGQQQS